MKKIPLFTFIIGIFYMATVAMAQEAAQPSRNINPPVLKVNDTVVYAAEISMVMQNISGQMQASGQVPDNQELVKVATQRVIEQKLLSQEAVRFGLKPDELRVAQMVQSAEQQAGGRETLDSNLQKFGSSYEDLVATIRELVLVQGFIAKQISPTIQVTDEEIKAFYTENPDRFAADEQVHARHILFAAAEGADKATVASAQTKANQARQRALADEDFATLASQLSEGPSAKDGGDLGFFSREQMLPSFAEAAFALEPGQISEVIRTRFGFHVIKVEERRPAGTLPFEEAAPNVRNFLTQQKTGKTVAELLQTLHESAKIESLIVPQAEAAQSASPADTVPE